MDKASTRLKQVLMANGRPSIRTFVEQELGITYASYRRRLNNDTFKMIRYMIAKTGVPFEDLFGEGQVLEAKPRKKSPAPPNEGKEGIEFTKTTQESYDGKEFDWVNDAIHGRAI